MSMAPVLDNSTRLAKRWMGDTRARLLVGVSISLLLGWLSVRGMDWGLVADEFQNYSIGWAFAALLIFILAILVRAYRWQVLFIGQKVSFMRLFMVQNAGIGLNSLMPIRIVSEGTQFALLTLRYGVKGE